MWNLWSKFICHKYYLLASDCHGDVQFELGMSTMMPIIIDQAGMQHRAFEITARGTLWHLGGWNWYYQKYNWGKSKAMNYQTSVCLLLIASLQKQKWNFVFNWLPLNQIQKEAHSWWVSAHKSQPVASELYGCDYWLQHWFRTNIMVHLKCDGLRKA